MKTFSVLLILSALHSIVALPNTLSGINTHSRRQSKCCTDLQVTLQISICNLSCRVSDLGCSEQRKDCPQSAPQDPAKGTQLDVPRCAYDGIKLADQSLIEGLIGKLRATPDRDICVGTKSWEVAHCNGASTIWVENGGDRRCIKAGAVADFASKVVARCTTSGTIKGYIATDTTDKYWVEIGVTDHSEGDCKRYGPQQ
ncbi:hypothetical protein K440DRAFT_659726 [Wilcoxina mikolae CBS 423.85]|nr:hypothetical protein K440DRAFT_659726 [Wilcoxina mikolae CBS 423.85]